MKKTTPAKKKPTSKKKATSKKTATKKKVTTKKAATKKSSRTKNPVVRKQFPAEMQIEKRGRKNDQIVVTLPRELFGRGEARKTARAAAKQQTSRSIAFLETRHSATKWRYVYRISASSEGSSKKKGKKRMKNPSEHEIRAHWMPRAGERVVVAGWYTETTDKLGTIARKGKDFTFFVNADDGDRYQAPFAALSPVNARAVKRDSRSATPASGRITRSRMKFSSMAAARDDVLASYPWLFDQLKPGQVVGDKYVFVVKGSHPARRWKNPATATQTKGKKSPRLQKVVASAARGVSAAKKSVLFREWDPEKDGRDVIVNYNGKLIPGTYMRERNRYGVVDHIVKINPRGATPYETNFHESEITPVNVSNARKRLQKRTGRKAAVPKTGVFTRSRRKFPTVEAAEEDILRSYRGLKSWDIEYVGSTRQVHTFRLIHFGS